MELVDVLSCEKHNAFHIHTYSVHQGIFSLRKASVGWAKNHQWGGCLQCLPLFPIRRRATVPIPEMVMRGGVSCLGSKLIPRYGFNLLAEQGTPKHMVRRDDDEEMIQKVIEDLTAGTGRYGCDIDFLCGMSR